MNKLSTSSITMKITGNDLKNRNRNIDSFMDDCPAWQNICNFFDKEQSMLDKEFKKMKGLGGHYGK